MIDRNEKFAVLLSIILTVLSAYPGKADTNSISIDQLLARALSESPEVKHITAGISEMHALATETGAIENPALESEVRFPVSYRENRGSNEVAVALLQPLRPSDFGARSKVAALINETARLDEKMELLAFSQRLKLAFAKSWALSQRASEIDSYRKRITGFEAEVGRASDLGMLSAAERSLFKAEAIKSRYELEAVHSDLARARAELSKIAGFVVQGILLRPEFRGLPSEEELIESGGHLPARERASLAVRLAGEQLKLAELDAYPKFAPKLVYERTSDYSDYVGVGISVDIPFFNRNKGQKSVRAAQLSEATSLDRYLSGPAFTEEVKALRSSIEASANLIDGYEKEIVPALREALLGEEKLLTAGQGSFFRLWQTFRELSNLEAETVERTVRLFAARAELAILTGTDF